MLDINYGRKKVIDFSEQFVTEEYKILSRNSFKSNDDIMNYFKSPDNTVWIFLIISLIFLSMFNIISQFKIAMKSYYNEFSNQLNILIRIMLLKGNQLHKKSI
jgi:hypothetical protein